MTTEWRIWIEVAPGAHEFLGKAEGDTFEAACRRFAEHDRDFAAQFDAASMTCRGCRLVALDRRRDGLSHVFGESPARDQDRTSPSPRLGSRSRQH